MAVPTSDLNLKALRDEWKREIVKFSKKFLDPLVEEKLSRLLLDPMNALIREGQKALAKRADKGGVPSMVANATTFLQETIKNFEGTAGMGSSFQEHPVKKRGGGIAAVKISEAFINKIQKAAQKNGSALENRPKNRLALAPNKRPKPEFMPKPKQKLEEKLALREKPLSRPRPGMGTGPYG